MVWLNSFPAMPSSRIRRSNIQTWRAIIPKSPRKDLSTLRASKNVLFVLCAVAEAYSLSAARRCIDSLLQCISELESAQKLCEGIIRNMWATCKSRRYAMPDYAQLPSYTVAAGAWLRETHIYRLTDSRGWLYTKDASPSWLTRSRVGTQFGRTHEAVVACAALAVNMRGWEGFCNTPWFQLLVVWPSKSVVHELS